jgi:hypothetical protein
VTPSNSATSPADEGLFKELAQSLDCAVAIVRFDGWEIVFENARFFRWFQPGADDSGTITGRIPSLKIDRAESRLEGGRTFNTDLKITIDDQETPLRLTVAPFPGHDGNYLLVQAHSTSKEMEVLQGNGGSIHARFLLAHGGEECARTREGEGTR